MQKMRRVLLALLFLALAATADAQVIPGGALPGPLPLFPADNWWNTDVSAAPVDPSSDAFITFIGRTDQLHPDLGGDAVADGSEIYGIPYIVVDASQPKVDVEFLYSDESDGVNHDTDTSFPFYPIPSEAITQNRYIEGGPAGSVDLRSESDRHMLIVDRDNKLLYELYNVYYDGSRWLAGSGALFDMKSNNRRPDGWTSADAAGLAILPGLIRYDEVDGPNEILHAFRMTLGTTNGYVDPASHRAGSTVGALPMGARLRLKASKDISTFPAEVQKIFRAMKTYGLIVADNGSDMYITGTHDARWDNGILNPAFGALTANDFDVIQLGWRPASDGRGDVNADGSVTVADIFYLINYLFAAGPPPIGVGDANSDGAVAVGDIFYLINFLFAAGSPP